MKLDEFIEITIADPKDFLKIKETLTRIGIASKRDNTLYQSCHILHKRKKPTDEKGSFFIVHFKEMFLLDGKPTEFTQEDLARRNTIANLLQDFKLLKLVDPKKSQHPVCPLSNITIIKYSEKNQWKLVPKYTIGNNKKRER